MKPSDTDLLSSVVLRCAGCDRIVRKGWWCTECGRMNTTADKWEGKSGDYSDCNGNASSFDDVVRAYEDCG